MKKRMVAVLLTLALVLASAMTFAAAETVLYVQGKTADRVHLRAAPSTDAQSLGLYFNGTAVVQLGWNGNGWMHVQIGSVTGYMHPDYLSDWNSASAAPTYVVNNTGSTWVNLRSAASASSYVHTICNNGTYVSLLGETADGWSYVRVGNLMGYIMTQFLKVAEGSTGESFATATELDAQVTVVGQTMNDGDIYRYRADNGQDIFFAADMPPVLLKQDVNFDGWDDLVVCVTRGATNQLYQFFIFRDGVYHLVTKNGYVVTLYNYALHPAKNIVTSHGTSGYAGALFVEEIYRWNGTELQLLRSAVSDEMVQEWSSGTNYHTTWYPDLLHAEVRDFTQSTHEGVVIWQQENVPLDAVDATYFTEIENALWQGL